MAALRRQPARDALAPMQGKDDGCRAISLPRPNAEIEAHKHEAEARKGAFLPAQPGFRRVECLRQTGGRRAEGVGQWAAEVEQQQKQTTIVLPVGLALHMFAGSGG